MPYYGFLIEEFLVVEALIDFKLASRAFDDCTFVGKGEFLCLYEVAALFQKSGLLRFLEVEKNHARIDEFPDEKQNQLSVMVRGCGILVIAYVNVPEFPYVVVEKKVYVKVKELVRHSGYQIGKKPEQGVR